MFSEKYKVRYFCFVSDEVACERVKFESVKKLVEKYKDNFQEGLTLEAPKHWRVFTENFINPEKVYGCLS